MIYYEWCQKCNFTDVVLNEIVSDIIVSDITPINGVFSLVWVYGEMYPLQPICNA